MSYCPPTLVADVFDQAAQADTDILAAPLTFSPAPGARSMILRIGVSLDTDATFKVTVTRGTTTLAFQLRGQGTAGALEKDIFHLFNFPVTDGDRVNFQAGLTVNVNRLTVEEVKGSVIA